MITAPDGIGERWDGWRRREPLVALTKQASLCHAFRKIGWRRPCFTPLQVEDILCLLHCSRACQPLAGLEKCRPHERQDALEVENRVVDVGGMALPGVEQPARQEATKSA